MGEKIKQLNEAVSDNQSELIQVEEKLSNRTLKLEKYKLKLKNAFGVEDLPEVCFASASIRKNKTTFSALGKIAYKPGGAKAWIAESNAILHSGE